MYSEFKEFHDQAENYTEQKRNISAGYAKSETCVERKKTEIPTE